MAKGGGADVGPTKRGKGMNENHGDSGSSWIVAFGQRARGKPSRGPLGLAVLRLLHDRSQAGELNW
jgi:hypothetical protein